MTKSGSTAQIDSPLGRTVATSPTDVSNNSCAADELEYALAYGAVGATADPSIVLGVLKKELAAWKGFHSRSHLEQPARRRGRDRLETDRGDGPARRTDADAGLRAREGSQGSSVDADEPNLLSQLEELVEQALHFDGLPTNIQVKIPVTAAGIEAIEEVTRLGVTINATVCFTLPQALAITEAVERGLKRRASEGLAIDRLHPACTIMIGRTDDWLKAVAKHDGIVITPGHLDWAGLAILKKAYGIFGARGYHPPAGGRLSPPHALVGTDRRRLDPDDPICLAGAV